MPKTRMILVVVAVGLVGCSVSPFGSAQDDIEQGDVVKVLEVFDGDSFLTDKGAVRMVGIDAPEKDECGYEGAGETLTLTLSPKGRGNTKDDVRIVLVPDGIQGERDKYGRMLRYVLIKGEEEMEDVGAMMVEEGWVRVAVEFEFDRKEDYLELEVKAKEEERGMWGEC